MKRQFCDQAKDSELTDDDVLECSYSQPLINTCCRKCKSCYGKSGSINPRQSDVALRLKEKSKKKKEAAEKEVNQSALKDTCKNGQTQRASEEMNSDDLDEYIAISQTAGSGGKTKLRSSSNNSSISADFDENKCTLKTDCKCKSCQKIQKLGEELIAEEESSKKKKAKKKKKKNGKKNQDTVEEDNEDDDTKVKPETEDEDSHEHVNSGSRNSNSVDPTSVDINQWIKVKNKNTANTHNLKNSISKTSLSSRSSLSSGYTLVASENHDQKTEMESNGFKLVGGKDNTEKKKGPTLEGVTKDLESMIITDLKNSPTATEKARLLSIDANLAYLRGELSDAIHLISQSIECDSKSPEYFINRSFYYEKSKNYSSALNDAEKAIKLEEVNENFFEYSLYRKAKALAGLNRFEIVESVLKSITKVLSAKCKNDVQAYNSFVIVIEKELMINRLKKLVSANYTLPLARLYALKFGSIKAAIAAIGDNIRLLDDANADSLDLKLHLQLINAQFQKNASTDSSVKDSKLLALIRASHPPQLSASQHKRISNKSSANQDLWNFNENDEESSSGDRPHLLLRDFCDTGGNQKIDEEAFLSQYDDDDDDSEIYFSDEDEYEMVYSNPDKWNEPKDILVNTGNAHYFTDELREPINSNGQKALWIGNVSPECSQNLVSHVFMKFGSVTFCNIFPNERSNEIAYLLLHYDNDISPRLVTTYFKDQVVPKISKDNHPLIIRFRNKNDKGEEGGDGGGGGVLNASNNNIPKTALNPASPQSPSHHHHPHQPYHLSALTSSANKQPLPQECYYWRTTGCDRDRCYFKHIPAHKSIDKQPWMRRKN